MGTIVGLLIFVGVMIVMNKLGLGCCGGHSTQSEHKGNNNNKSCCSSEKNKVYKDDFEK